MKINSPFGIEVCVKAWISKEDILDFSIMDYLNRNGSLGWKHYRWLSIGIINIELLWEYELKK